MICSVGDAGEPAQIAVPQHGADLLGDAAPDQPAQYPHSGVAAEIGLDQRAGDAGERHAFDRQCQFREQGGQGLDLALCEALRAVGGPIGIERVHLADRAGAGKAADHHRDIAHALVAQLHDGREIGGLARVEARPKQRCAGLEQVKEHAAPPVRGRFALAGRVVFDDLGLRLSALASPAEAAAFVDRVQGVDDDRGAGDRQPGLDGAPAEAVEQRGLALAGEPGLGQPGADMRQAGGVHAATRLRARAGSFPVT